jgi:hypothetical protein
MLIVFSSSSHKRSTQLALGLVSAFHVLVATCILLKIVARVRRCAVSTRNSSTVVSWITRERSLVCSRRNAMLCGIYSLPYAYSPSYQTDVCFKAVS